MKSRALKENLLGKGSHSRISSFSALSSDESFMPRGLWTAPSAIARFLAAESKVPAAAKAQLLLVFAVNEDIALGDAFRTLVIPADRFHVKDAPSGSRFAAS